MSEHHVVFYHLLNDYSGSPKALLSVIEKALADGARVDIFTSSGGPLDSLEHPRLTRHVIPYQFKGRAVGTAVNFAWAQILGFFSTFRYFFKRKTLFYINTILPAGAALGARLTGHRLIVHCHENPRAKGLVYQLLSHITLPLANKVICVSAAQAADLPSTLPIEIRPNVLPLSFLSRVTPDPERAFERKNVLMLASLKDYKGIPEFLKLASTMPDFKFTLVISAEPAEIDANLKETGQPVASNVSIYPCQQDVVPFYNEASIVVNLSNPDLFIETSGLTALEARSFLLPVIVPCKGGITETITHGVDGFHIDSRNVTKMQQAITQLLTDRRLYLRMARGTNSNPNPKISITREPKV